MWCGSYSGHDDPWRLSEPATKPEKATRRHLSYRVNLRIPERLKRAGKSTRVLMARRVLVVDDDVLVLELLACMLADLGCDTLTARSATEALGTIAKDERIEILITILTYRD
jgi:PleD family two-component response regulator